MTLLRKSLQDCVGLLRHSHQTELKLRPCLNHPWDKSLVKRTQHHQISTCSLVPDVLQRCCYVYLLGPFGHPVEDHVDQDVGPGPPNAVAAVQDHRAAAASVALVNFPNRECIISSSRGRGRQYYLCFLLPRSGIKMLLLRLVRVGWY